MLSHVAHLHAPVGHAAIVDAARTPKNNSNLATVTSLVINDVALSNEKLIANATLTGTLKKHAFSLPLVLPITLTPSSSATPAAATPDTAAPVQVLNLSLGPLNLSLLGLNIHLGAVCSFGDTTPITAQVVAIPTGATYTSGGTTYTGGLLGDVLADVANLLNGGSPLSSLGTETNPLANSSTGLVGPEIDQLETGLAQILNQVLSGLTSSTASSGAVAKAARAGSHGAAMGHAAAVTPASGGHTAAATTQQILQLPLGPITLDLLGAFVHTSTICLDITATKGPGNLLGNLL